MNIKNKRRKSFFVKVIAVFIMFNCLSVPISMASSTDWLGFWGGKVRSGDLNPTIHDAAKAHIKPCTTLLTGKVYNKASIDIAIKYFPKNSSTLKTNRSKTFSWAKQQFKVSNDMSTGWFASTISDSYAIGADIHFSGYCFEHGITLNERKYIPEE